MKVSNMKFQGNSSNRSRANGSIQTDRHTDMRSY